MRTFDDTAYVVYAIVPEVNEVPGKTAPAAGSSAYCKSLLDNRGYVNVNVNNLLAISESDFDNSGEPGPQAEGVNHL